MLKSILVRTIDLCTRHPWTVILAAAVLSGAAAIYAVENFAINTDTSKLLSPELPWRQREHAFETAFPQRNDIILVVVEAATPELARDASDRLADALSKRGEAVVSVRQPGAGPFFEKNGLLYLPVDEVERSTRQLATAKPLISGLAANRNLKGVMDAIQLGLMGIQAGQLKLDDAERPMTLLSETVEDVLAGKPASFSWRVLLQGRPAKESELRRFIEVKPVLDFSALEPGHRATSAIR